MKRQLSRREFILTGGFGTIAMFLFGCEKDSVKNFFAPKTIFYGVIKNLTQWQLWIPDPAHPDQIHKLNPGQYFYAELEGSYEYHFEAKFPGPQGELYSSFNARINQISSDATVNGVQVDWCWFIGGEFDAAVTPVISNNLSARNIPAPEVHIFPNRNSLARAMKRYESAHPVREEK